jgi:hypothetical protein
VTTEECETVSVDFKFFPSQERAAAAGQAPGASAGLAQISCFKVDSESAGPSPSLPGAAAAAGPATMNRIMMPPRLR